MFGPKKHEFIHAVKNAAQDNRLSHCIESALHYYFTYKFLRWLMRSAPGAGDKIRGWIKEYTELSEVKEKVEESALTIIPLMLAACAHYTDEERYVYAREAYNLAEALYYRIEDENPREEYRLQLGRCKFELDVLVSIAGAWDKISENNFGQAKGFADKAQSLIDAALKKDSTRDRLTWFSKLQEKMRIVRQRLAGTALFD